MVGGACVEGTIGVGADALGGVVPGDPGAPGVEDTGDTGDDVGDVTGLAGPLLEGGAGGAL
jgi:hypothetical protein